MVRFTSHIKNFFYRLQWLSPMMGGALNTAINLIKIQGNPFGIVFVKYNDISFESRNCDLSAVKEVLVDAEYEFLSMFLSSHSAPVIVDVGAHIGTFSLWVHHQNPKSKILMIEANTASYDVLSRNIKRYFSSGQYTILNNAAWKNNDKLKFSTAGDSMGNKVSKAGNINVDGITFSDIVELMKKESPSINLMKIDIEGAEEAFFETSDSALDHVERLVIELHPKYCDTSMVREKLAKRYKNIQEFSGRKNSKPVLYCTDGF